MSQESLTLQENVTLSLVGIGIALLFLLCTLYQSTISVKRRNASKRKQRSSEENSDEAYKPYWLWDVTGYLRYPRRFVFALSTSEVYFASRRLIPCLFYRIWQKYRYGRVFPGSSPKHINNMASGSFPLTRLVPTTDLVVAYSKEFVSEFSSSPRTKGRRSRYALLLKSATPEAKADIERYFGSVVEDILSVRQVSSFVYIMLSGRSRFVRFHFPARLLCFPAGFKLNHCQIIIITTYILIFYQVYAFLVLFYCNSSKRLSTFVNNVVNFVIS